MEQTQRLAIPQEKILQVFARYFKYVVIIGLVWALRHQTERIEALEKEKTELMQKDIIDKADAIRAWRNTKENDNKLFDKLLDRLSDEKVDRAGHDSR